MYVPPVLPTVRIQPRPQPVAVAPKPKPVQTMLRMPEPPRIERAPVAQTSLELPSPEALGIQLQSAR